MARTSRITSSNRPTQNRAGLSGTTALLKRNRTEQIQLGNGLRVILHPQNDSPIVTLNVLYHVGSRHERSGQRGYAHLLEHLMFDGSKTLRRGEYDRYCTIAGGENNAWTSTDLTDYWITLPAGELKLGCFLESDRMAEFAIGEESLETQKNVVQAEKRQVIDNVPYGDEGSRMRELLYAGAHPYRYEPIGLPEDISRATLSDIRQFYDRYYRPSNAILTVAGQFDSAEAIELVEQHFGEIVRDEISGLGAEYDISLLPDRITTPNREKIFDRLVPLNAVFLGWHLPPVTDRLIPAVELLCMILSDGDSSRLTLALEYDPLIASESGAYFEEGELGSTFCAYAIAQNNRISPGRLERAILEQISEITRSGIREEELQKAKNRKISGIVQSLQSISNRAERLAWYGATFGDPDLLWNEPELYRNVSIDEIVQVAREYLVESPTAAIEYRPRNEG